uniref:Uncharacterized protein n=1 Tax=Oryza punctata TaxID=4537 RepID=A0A0E0M8J9_ORYPU
MAAAMTPVRWQLLLCGQFVGIAGRQEPGQQEKHLAFAKGTDVPVDKQRWLSSKPCLQVPAQSGPEPRRPKFPAEPMHRPLQSSQRQQAKPERGGPSIHSTSCRLHRNLSHRITDQAAANSKRDRLRPLYLWPRAAQAFASSIAIAGRKPGETLTSPPPPNRENAPHLRPFRRERREVERVETAAEPRAPEPERSDTAAGGVAVREVLQLRHFPSDGGIGPENALMDKLRYIRFGSLAGSVFGICPNRMFCDRSR